MSTIGGLLLPQIQPGDYGRSMNQGIAGAGGLITNETALFALRDAQRQQATQEQMQAYLAAHPEALLGAPGGQSVLGQLGAAPAPLLQQSVTPGQPPAAPTMVPGGQDLSRFASGAPSPPSGMAPGGQANPLEALMRQDPAAALQVMDMQAKRQTGQMTLKARIADYVGSVLQGAHDQESYEEARQEVGRVAPEWAQRMPPTYSAQAVQPYIERALSVKDNQLLQIEAVKAETERLKLGRPGKVDYGYGNEIDAALDARFGDQIRQSGGRPTQPMVAQAIKDVEDRHVGRAVETFRQTAPARKDIAAETGMNAARLEKTEKPMEATAAKAVSDLTTLRTMTDDLSKLYKPAYAGWENRLGWGAAKEAVGAMAPEEAAFRATATDIQDILGRLRTGAVINPQEMRNLESLAPGPKTAPALFPSQLQRFQRALEQTRESYLRVGTTGREQLRQETQPTTPRVGERASAFRPVTEMSLDDRRAERDALLRKR